MKTLRRKWLQFYEKHTPSVKLPLVIFALLICMIPLILQGRVLASSSKQNQIERRIIDVQNQCQIMSKKMTRTGYLYGKAADNVGVDTELSMLADIFNGRILIVNSGFKIVKVVFLRKRFAVSKVRIPINIIQKSIISFLRSRSRRMHRHWKPVRLRKQPVLCW